MGVRNDVVVVVDDTPISWNSLYLEVKEDTDLGKRALEILDKLNILTEK